MQNTSGGRFACVAHISKWIYFNFQCGVSIKSRGEFTLANAPIRIVYGWSVQTDNHSSCLFIARMAKVADVGSTRRQCTFLLRQFAADAHSSWSGEWCRVDATWTNGDAKFPCVCEAKICDLFAEENMFAVTRLNGFFFLWCSLNPPSRERAYAHVPRMMELICSR